MGDGLSNTIAFNEKYAVAERPSAPNDGCGDLTPMARTGTARRVAALIDRPPAQTFRLTARPIRSLIDIIDSDGASLPLAYRPPGLAAPQGLRSSIHL
jgi:hypothetical protein